MILKQSGIKNVLLPLVTLSFFIFNFFSCKDNTVDPPPDNKPPGYQEDIPWPSLADSPWPKFRHDAQNTGRSNLPGPSGGVIDWKLDSMYLAGELVADSSNIFIPSSFPANFLCYDLNGNFRWKSPLNGIKIFPTPILTSEGNIIAADAQKVYSFTKNGNINWTFTTNSTGLFITGPTVDKEGNIYLVDGSGILYSLNKHGSLNWTFQNSDFSPSEGSGIAFSPDGKTIYLAGKNTSIISFNLAEKKINWSIDRGLICSSPMVDYSGNIYFISGNSPNKMSFYSINSSGEERFSYEFMSEWEFKLDAAIDKNGNLYFAGDTLYCLNYEGKLKWKTDMPASNSAPLSIDRDGNIYLILTDFRVLCMDNSGNIKYSVQLDLPASGMSGFSPVIGMDNKLYVNILAVSHASSYCVFSVK